MSKVSLFIAGAMCLAALACASCTKGAVKLSEDEQTYTLDNGIVRAVVAKASGDLVSVKYNGQEMLATRMDADGNPDLVLDPPGANPNGLNRGMTDHQYGFWSHDAMGPIGTGDAIATITKKGGKIGEVSVKGISEGRLMGTGPGASPKGQFASDIEIRYAMEANSPKIYTYCIFTHPESYPKTSIGEARFCAKLAPTFDWMSVDELVDFHYPTTHNAGDKYVYTANQNRNRAFGWSSTKDNIGFFVINPSMEYMSGGPTKVEFMGHRDTNQAAAACVLNYWRSSHYGGAAVDVEAGEYWQKVIGPFVIYLNSGADHTAIYEDAKAEAVKEAAKWPYKWVKSEAYASKKERATVSGKMTIDDPAAPASFENFNIGLTSPDFFWQKDAKHYQFWAVGNGDGTFSIPNVREGKYTLVAFTNGVLGEYSQADVVVTKGKDLNLGEIVWKPVRNGKQVFEIGVPNRNGVEFYNSQGFRDPNVVLKYAEEFPNDVDYTVGKSDWSKDWPYLHVPHNENPDTKVLPFFGIMGNGRETPYNIHFNMDNAGAGKATLRFAICGTACNILGISVNGEKVGELVLQRTGDGVITRHGSHGIWYETSFGFDAAKLVKGANTVTLTIPAGSLNNGILYDYIRLEVE